MEESWRVILVHKDRCLVRRGDEELFCVTSGGLRYRGEAPVVGDWVEITVNPYGDSLIRAILPRRTVFCRPDRGGHADGFVKTMQVEPMIANFDYVFIITSLNQDYSLNRIARYAAATSAGGAVPVAVLTKADLCADVAAAEAQTAALSERLEVVAVSAYTGFGLDRLKRYCAPGRTIALLGSSGAGKSTLINTLAGREIMRVGGIREEDAKGRHTTTHREMIDVDGVGFIDTPGLRELGLIDAEEGLDDTFSDIAALTARCAFSDCTHRSEPGCAVRQALEEGALSYARWETYSSLLRENNWSKRKKNDMMKRIAMYNRAQVRARKDR